MPRPIVMTAALVLVAVLLAIALFVAGAAWRARIGRGPPAAAADRAGVAQLVS